MCLYLWIRHYSDINTLQNCYIDSKQSQTTAFFYINWQADYILYENAKDLEAQSTCAMEKQAGKLTTDDFQGYQELSPSHHDCYSLQDKHLNQWFRTESTVMNPPLCGKLIFNKDIKITQWGNYRVSL